MKLTFLHANIQKIIWKTFYRKLLSTQKVLNNVMAKLQKFAYIN